MGIGTPKFRFKTTSFHEVRAYPCHALTFKLQTVSANFTKAIGATTLSANYSTTFKKIKS